MLRIAKINTTSGKTHQQCYWNQVDEVMYLQHLRNWKCSAIQRRQSAILWNVSQSSRQNIVIHCSCTYHNKPIKSPINTLPLGVPFLHKGNSFRPQGLVDGSTWWEMHAHDYWSTVLSHTALMEFVTPAQWTVETFFSIQWKGKPTSVVCIVYSSLYALSMYIHDMSPVPGFMNNDPWCLMIAYDYG